MTKPRFLSSRIVLVLFAPLTMEAIAQDRAVTCTAAKPVVSNREAIEVTAWGVKNGTIAWTADSGELDAREPRAIWDLTGANRGRHSATVQFTPTLGGATSTCTVTVFVEPGMETRGDRLPRRFLLSPGASEAPDYGMYSYVLLAPDRDDPGIRARNREAIRGWIAQYSPSEDIERVRHKRELNATYVPVKTSLPDSADADAVLKEYDYQRADRWLAALAPKRTAGPYLVSSKRPLGDSPPRPLLILDAHWAPPSTIKFWIHAFQAQSFQEQFDQPRAFDSFNLHLRTIMSVFAEEAPQALGSIISIGR